MMRSPAVLGVIVSAALCGAPRLEAAALSDAQTAVLAAFAWMASNLGIEKEAHRGAHEFSAEKVIAAKKVFGCVESAKVFKKKCQDLAPAAVTCAYVGGTLRGQDGGHAVVEVSDAGGSYLVDSSGFEAYRTPRYPDNAGKLPVGSVMQLSDSSGAMTDLVVKEGPDGYAVTRYEYGRAGSAQHVKGSPSEFKTLDELNEWLAKEFGAGDSAMFDKLKAQSLIVEETTSVAVGDTFKVPGCRSPTGPAECYVFEKVSGTPTDAADWKADAGWLKGECPMKYPAEPAKCK